MEYPKLYEELESCSHARVLWICLGPNQTYFLKRYGGYHYLLTPAFSSKIREVYVRGGLSANITAVALGINITYVIVQKTHITWDLKGYYNKLDAILRRSTSVPKYILLNHLNRDSRSVRLCD